ncbi:MAG TPA: hypothetical protein VKV29_13640 [Chthonomonas sp.]|uniref:hypothetical protein n=1 Tax=Chthonomonas sp. TaxID=2282153 RepID=UPI002B4B6437|nr:hypothetical protein [Chthonomonas sp.]HLH81311.1 hypothetical protein [Chthonomonas sp.]
MKLKISRLRLEMTSVYLTRNDRRLSQQLCKADALPLKADALPLIRDDINFASG